LLAIAWLWVRLRQSCVLLCRTCFNSQFVDMWFCCEPCLGIDFTNNGYAAIGVCGLAITATAEQGSL
jgi:hypothetical protein